MDSRVQKILEALHPHGVGKTVNISSTLLEMFPNVDRMNQADVNDACRTIFGVMSNMKYSGLIGFDGYPAIGHGNTSTGYSWFEGTKWEVSLTHAGNERIEDEQAKSAEDRLRESMLDTNESIRSTNEVTRQNIHAQKKLTTVALWIAGTSAFIALLSFLITIWPKNSKPIQVQLQRTDSVLISTEQKLDSLSQRILKFDSALTIKNIDSPSKHPVTRS